MRLRLPPGLNYPITVTKLLKAPADDVAFNEALVRYDFRITKEEDDYLGETQKVEKIFPSVFESEVEGVFGNWLIREGQVINGPIDLADIDEPCTHEVQFHGICAMCGKDMTEMSYNKRIKDTSRAGINMVHDDVNLKISSKEASRSEEEAKKTLIRTRRLSLVVDLDQTIIHATVDPTVGEWQQDPSNPNHPAVADVKAFQLADDGPGSRSCWYYIKTRPGLESFLRKISKIYELHIYTMGTRAYAQQIAKIVDPDRSIFGDRILSRDESGSLTVKTLQRLFPIDTKMVVIIDDRGDVWKWSDNLVKVTPYDFFVGIGDINSSFLPQKQRARSTPKEETVSAQQNGGANGDANGASSALDQLVSMSGSDDPNKLKDQSEKAAQVIDNQLEARPLLQKQKALDKVDEETDTQTAQEESESPERPRHHLLEDHDNELYFLERSLTQVHSEYYDQYERNLSKAEKPAEKPSQGEDETKKEDGPAPNLDALPDIQVVLPGIKRRVLNGVSICFSGVVPLGADIFSHEIAIQAQKFGAKVTTEVRTSRTTHVVAAKKGTAKVKKALRRGRGRIKVVSTQWLMDSIVRWSRQEETPYLLHSEEDEIAPIDPRVGVEEDDADILSESEEPVGEDAGLTDGDTTDAEQERKQIKLRLKTGRQNEIGTEIDEGEDIDELSPVTPFDEDTPIANAAGWQEIDDEIADFMGSDEESDDEADPDTQSSAPVVTDRSLKRSSDEAEDSQSNRGDEPPKKKLRDDDNANGESDDGFEEDFEAAWDDDGEDEA